MKNIAHKNRSNTTKRVNRITTFFKKSNKATKAQTLQRLRYEARFIHDVTVKNWIIQFEKTLKEIGGQK